MKPNIWNGVDLPLEIGESCFKHIDTAIIPIVKISSYDYKKLSYEIENLRMENKALREDTWSNYHKMESSFNKEKQDLHIDYKNKIEALEKQLKEASIVRKQLECIHEDGIFVDHEFWKKQKEELRTNTLHKYVWAALALVMVIIYSFRIGI